MKRFAANAFLAMGFASGLCAIPQQSPALPFGIGQKAGANDVIPVARYADVADLVTIAPVIIDATVIKTTRVSKEQAAGLPPTLQRLVVEANVNALVRGDQGINTRVRFLFDLKQSPDGSFPPLKKLRFFFMANYTNTPGTVKLVTPRAYIQYSIANDYTVRQITKEAVLLDAPQKITGVASAFHSAGTIIGEGETQIFLDTEKNQPVALSISSKAGAPKKWSVSTSELVGESARTPPSKTLLWYRLACGLPVSLPSAVLDGASESDAKALREDYAFVKAALGSCRS